MNYTRQNPYFNTAIDEGAVDEGVFGFYLASSGSALYRGGTNDDLYSGSLEYHDVDTSTGFWQITGAKVYVGSKAAVSNFETIIDSGTTLAYGEWGIRVKGNGMRITAKQLKSADEALRRKLKPIKGAKVYMRVFPDIPVCIKVRLHSILEDMEGADATCTA